MSNLLTLLAESAAALDKAGMFREADMVDDMLMSLAANPTPPQKNAIALLNEVKSIVGGLKGAGDVGTSVVLKQIVDMLGQLGAALTTASRSKQAADAGAVRSVAKDVLLRFLAMSNGQNAVTNEVLHPVVKPVVDRLQLILRLPDNLIWS